MFVSEEKAKKILFLIVYVILKNIPGGRIVNTIRGRLLGSFMKGSRVGLQIGRSVNIANPDSIFIGDNVVINAETYLVASEGKIIVGDHVLIAPRCLLQTQNHNYKDKNILIMDQGTAFEDIVIERDSWLAYGVSVMPGVKIRQGSVIGACSVVTKDSEEYSVNVGSPARKISERIIVR